VLECIYFVLTTEKLNNLIQIPKKAGTTMTTKNLKTEMLSVKTSPNVKENAAKVLDQFGMTISQAVNMYLLEIIRTKKIPLNLYLPTEDVSNIKDLIKEAEKSGFKRFNDF
jgi:addiction module RelB/DinJ family antitoxin